MHKNCYQVEKKEAWLKVLSSHPPMLKDLSIYHGIAVVRHEVASLYDKTIPLMNYFITTYGFDKRVLRIDETYWDLELPPTKSSKASFRDFQNQTNH